MRTCVFLFLLLPLHIFAQPPAPLWKAKYDTAQIFWKQDINHSIAMLSQAEGIAFNDLGIYDENYLTIINDLGVANGEIREYKKAEIYLRRNLAIRKELYTADDMRVLQSKCNLASILQKAGDLNDAKILYWEVLHHWGNRELTALYFIAVADLATIYESQEKYDSALIIIRPATDRPDSGSEFQLVKGRILRKMKKYDEAEKILLTLKDQLADSVKGQILLNTTVAEISLIDIEKGLYVKAERELLRLYHGLAIVPAGDNNLLTSVTNELGYVYEKLGIWDKALAYYTESLDRCTISYGISSFSCLIMQNNIAGIYLKQEKIRDAIAAYERFIDNLKISDQKNSTFLTATTNLATAYREDGQYERSLKHLSSVYKVLADKNELGNDLAATVMNNMSVTYALMGEFDKAAGYFEKVLAIKQSLYGAGSPVLLDIVNNLAISYWALKKYDKAMPLFERSLALASREVNYVFPNLTEIEQVQFYREQKHNFERFNTLAVSSFEARPELLVHMFNNQLLLKSLAFFTSKKRNSLIEAKNDARLIALGELLESKSIQLGHCYQLPVNELRTLRLSIPVLERQVDSLEKVMRHKLNDDSFEDHDAKWIDIRDALKPNEAVIEIIRFRKYDILTEHTSNAAKKVKIGFTDSVYYAALITTRESKLHPSLVLLKNGNYLESRLFRYYRNTLRFDVDDPLSYDLYWRPFEGLIAGKEKIYFSADGVFHQMNLNAIHDRDGKYILEKYDLDQIMNASQLVHRSPELAIDFSQIVLFGDPDFDSGVMATNYSGIRESYNFAPLPGSRQEVRGIMDVLKIAPTRRNLFLQKAANEDNLRSVRSPSILHIATHGFFSSRIVYLNDQVKNDFLFHSGIILSSTTTGVKMEEQTFENDGVVTAYDVMNLDLTNTSLVVLSACETGLGKVEIGEGVYGLQRSFLQAGASDVLVSLWKVEDGMTRDLMIRFYTYLGQRKTTRESFRLGQLDMLKKVGNPRLWAGFVMVSGN